jgi:hypothetical protein
MDPGRGLTMDAELDRLRKQLASIDRELERAEREADIDALVLREQRQALLAQIEREEEIRKQVERVWTPSELDQDLERDFDR